MPLLMLLVGNHCGAVRVALALLTPYTAEPVSVPQPVFRLPPATMVLAALPAVLFVPTE
ncbi:hypothetical protein D3C71_2095520 [compost metagenome]